MSAPWIVERVEARNAGHVAELVRDGGGLPWFPTGGGTALGRGGPPPSPVRALGLGALREVIEHAADDLTVTVEGGIAVGAVRSLLAATGQWAQCLEGIDPGGTVGGMVASDRRGPWAGGWGSARDALLGIAFVDGEGRPARGGGRVVKNVAGYDLMKLLTGSLGEYGVIVEATLRVLPRPPALGGAMLEAGDPREAGAAIAAASGRGWPVGLWRFDRGDGDRLAAVYAGPRGHVEACGAETRRAWGSGARALDREEIEDLVSGFAAWTRPGPKTTGWGGALPAYLAAASPGTLFRGGAYWLDLLGGHLWCRGVDDAATVSAIRADLRRGEGHLHLDRAPGAGTPAGDVWGLDPSEESALWRGIKAAFDPRSRLVAGRLPGGI